MTRNERVCIAVGAGAVVGSAIAYCFLTDRGRWMRRQLELNLESLANEFYEMSRTVARVVDVAKESQAILDRTIHDVVGRAGRESFKPIRSHALEARV